MNVAIFGTGRLGRAVIRQVAKRIASGKTDILIASIFDMNMDASALEYHLKHDSTGQKIPEDITCAGDGDTFHLGIYDIPFYNVPSYSMDDFYNMPLGEIGIDVLIDCTGLTPANGSDEYDGYIDAGARASLIAKMPTRDSDAIIIPVNESYPIGDVSYDRQIYFCPPLYYQIPCLLNNTMFGPYYFTHGSFIALQGYDASEELTDGITYGVESRAAAYNVIPKKDFSLDSVQATTIPFKTYTNKSYESVLTVPVLAGSMLLCQIQASRAPNSGDSIVTYFKSHVTTAQDVYSESPLVTSDVIGSEYAYIIDASSVKAYENGYFHMTCFYDAENGYAAQLIRAVQIIGDRMFS